jgi:hypothetical protein
MLTYIFGECAAFRHEWDHCTLSVCAASHFTAA